MSRKERWGLRRISSMFSVGERRTFASLSEMIELGREANSSMIEMMSSGGSLVIHNENIRLLEKKADHLSFEIKQEITGGAVNPNVIDNLLECVDLADSITDNHYWVSRELSRFSRVNVDGSFPVQPREIDALFLRSLELAEEAMMVLLRMLGTSDLDEIVSLRGDIELLEEEGDNLRDSGFDILYASARDLHFLQFMHVSEMLRKFDDILDSCEDMADLLLSITTTISR